MIVKESLKYLGNFELGGTTCEELEGFRFRFLEKPSHAMATLWNRLPCLHEQQILLYDIHGVWQEPSALTSITKIVHICSAITDFDVVYNLEYLHDLNSVPMLTVPSQSRVAVCCIV